MTQIEMMAAIYQGAYATLVDLYGSSSNGGLPRFNTSIPQNDQLIFHIDGIAVASTLRTLQEHIATSVWSTRAWTLQELELSNRVLYFTQDQIYYDCKVIQRQETLHDSEPDVIHKWTNTRRLLCNYELHDITDTESRIRHIKNHVATSTSDDYNMSERDEYVAFAKRYAPRTMSKESDAVKACAAILQIMTEKRFSKGFYYAIPMEIFTAVIGWRHRQQVKRRHDFPSWSWIGWEGSIDGIASHLGNRGQHTAEGPIFLSIYKLSDSRLQLLGESSSLLARFLHRHAGRNGDPNTIANVHETLEAAERLSIKTSVMDSALIMRGFIFHLKSSVLDIDYGNVYSVFFGQAPCSLRCDCSQTSLFLRQQINTGIDLAVIGLRHKQQLNRESLIFHTMVLKWQDGSAERAGRLDLVVPVYGRWFTKVMRAGKLRYGCYVVT